MTAVVVTAAAVTASLGDDLAGVWERLLAGESGIAPVTRFSTEAYGSQLAACIPGLKTPAGASLLEPLLERLLGDLPSLPEGCTLITATTKGAIDRLEGWCRGRAGRGLGGALPQNLGTLVAHRLGLDRPGMNLSAACASSTIAVAKGAARIAAGRAEAVLIVCADLVSEFVYSGFSALQALDPRPCRPFDRDRRGLCLGEGGAALLLMSESRCRAEGRPILGRLLGWGVANDAHHITAPARDGCGLVQAVEEALRVAGLPASVVAAINAHGTGTVYNDLMELTAFRTLFGERPLPLHSVKGALGHTLGAAGGIEVAIGLKSLAVGCLPPTAGFEHPETAAEGLVSAAVLCFDGEVLLTTNSGFGGINAALLLGRGEGP